VWAFVMKAKIACFLLARNHRLFCYGLSDAGTEKSYDDHDDSDSLSYRRRPADSSLFKKQDMNTAFDYVRNSNYVLL